MLLKGNKSKENTALIIWNKWKSAWAIFFFNLVAVFFETEIVAIFIHKIINNIIFCAHWKEYKAIIKTLKVFFSFPEIHSIPLSPLYMPQSICSFQISCSKTDIPQMIKLKILYTNLKKKYEHKYIWRVCNWSSLD